MESVPLVLRGVVADRIELDSRRADELLPVMLMPLGRAGPKELGGGRNSLGTRSQGQTSLWALSARANVLRVHLMAHRKLEG